MTFPAGAKIRASQLNEAFPLHAMAVTDTSVTNSTTLVVAAGLALPLDADAQYAIDGYLAYSAGLAGALRIRLGQQPAGSWTGHWNFFGLAPGAVGSVGSLNAVRIGDISGNLLLLAGSDSFSGALAARIAGYIDTDTGGGNLQVQFAQAAASATPTIVRQGSWIRARRVAS